MTEVEPANTTMNETFQQKSGANSAQTIEIYKQALTFNVVAKYDPSISQLLHISSYCVIYQYDEDAEDWVKSSYNGPVCVYARRSVWDKYGDNIDDNQIKKVNVNTILNGNNGEYYRFGLLVLNRGQPDNFSLGFLGDKYIEDKDVIEERGLLIEKSDQLIIVKDFNGKAFGLWIFDEKDRDYLFQLLMYCTDQLV
ncbi:mRNA-decapping enzyme subunit 1 [Pichia californica]|uniref:mRNA-decapping enzyme subunit 1 n=1 Tax=Pichia californica TaxID=460514 RepID=A0A9P7BG89_9ASCO|nr:mRNA-decapping enzyme subunit 1 [[Candida] californica]KAG0688008.1 mRNA-decapping enzyme subunit 1 [[Candida] californica]